METLFHDLRYAVRTLLKSPGFTAVAVLTLALGIGANSAIFSVVDSVLLRPLPYHEPERLVSLWPEGAFPKAGLLAYRDQTETFEAVAGYSGGSELSLTGRGDPVRLNGVSTSAELFDVLGAEALLGRTFLPGEDRVGAEKVVVFSHALWRQRFGADLGIIGERITLNGIDRTVVGVMPPDFQFPSRDTRLWLAVTIDPSDVASFWWISYLNPVARLRPGATLEQAQAELDAFMPRLREMFPLDMPEDWGAAATAVRLKEESVAAIRPMLLILLGATGFVLLIACANVANLLLTRATGRERELAIRTALGAGRRRVIRQLLTESGVLALLGGAAGLLLAFLGVRLLASRLPAEMPRVDEIGIDGRALVFTAAVSLITALLFGLLPALRAARAGPQAALKEAGRGGLAGRRQRTVSGVLVISEVALAVVLVIGASLLIESFRTLLQVNPGFRTEHVATARVAPPELRYDDVVAQRAFYRELLQRLRSLPGVRSAAVGSGVPFGGDIFGGVFVIEGRPDPGTQGGDWPLADAYVSISPDYLRALGIPLLRGRTFTSADREDAPGVALISESLARRYWPDEDPIGKRFRRPGEEGWTTTIVGIVGDVKTEQLSDDNQSAIYLPFLQAWAGPMRVVLRTTADPARVAAGIRDVVASVDEDTPVTDIGTMKQLVSVSVAERRFTMLLLGAFAALALALGAVGIYGVIAYAVGQRTHEVGIRMALGARASDVSGMVLRQGAVLALVGVGLGLVAALGLTRFLGGMLYGVSATDPLIFAAVALLLTAVALAASYLPARRATKVDPMTAVRCE